ncbi:phosphopantetheine-binding protein [Dactylosporangium sp. CA-139114]|uniref:phosphopantetheine-binding protein n=1 Tax=Dactylosporangium sp. CA-139114 TaxID=3239931 RepID=UPI003D986565
MNPANPVEQIVTAAWLEVLGTDSAAPHDAFFESGGHSFAAVQLLTAVQSALAVEFPLELLFSGTLRTLIAECTQRVEAKAAEGTR